MGAACGADSASGLANGRRHEGHQDAPGAHLLPPAPGESFRVLRPEGGQRTRVPGLLLEVRPGRRPVTVEYDGSWAVAERQLRLAHESPREVDVLSARARESRVEETDAIEDVASKCDVRRD